MGSVRDPRTPTGGSVPSQLARRGRGEPDEGDLTDPWRALLEPERSVARWRTALAALAGGALAVQAGIRLVLSALRRPLPPRWASVTPDLGRRRRRATSLDDHRNRLTPLVLTVATIATAAYLPLALGKSDQPVPSVRPPLGPSVEQRSPVRYSQTSAGAGLPWADEAQREQSDQRLPPDPIGGYVAADLSSRFTNVRDGARATTAPPNCSCPTATVWFTGGSAAFGYGQRDEGTVASWLVDEASRSGVALTVRNIAVPGYTRWQELQGVLARLAAGEAPPDIVLFYDGFNDLFGSLKQSLVATPRFRDPVVFDALTLESILDADERPLAERIEALGGAEAVGRRAGQRLRDLTLLTKALLEERGTRVLFATQPDFAASPLQREAVLSTTPEFTAEVMSLYEPFMTAGYAEVEPLSIDLRDIYDGLERPVFFDLSHTNEEGARLVAEALWPELGLG